MLRAESEDGWWLITHQDHAQLAAAFAQHWGNSYFLSPQPRDQVMLGIRCHDDGWAARDAHPRITKEGKPSAFSHELVGKYSAFEEINLAEYLDVRSRALALMETQCPYAALLISMHTYSLLSEHADRTTIRQEQLPLFDSFLLSQQEKQRLLRQELAADKHFAEDEVSDDRIVDNFRLLQAVDNLSLYSCVGYMNRGTLLHPLPTPDGTSETVEVCPTGLRQFQLKPYPFDEPFLTFTIPARHVQAKTFASSEDLENMYNSSAIQELTITLSN